MAKEPIWLWRWQQKGARQRRWIRKLKSRVSWQCWQWWRLSAAAGRTASQFDFRLVLNMSTLLCYRATCARKWKSIEWTSLLSHRILYRIVVRCKLRVIYWGWGLWQSTKNGEQIRWQVLWLRGTIKKKTLKSTTFLCDTSTTFIASFTLWGR